MEFRWGYNKCHADVAQPEEQRFRKPQVKGSSPFIGSIFAIPYPETAPKGAVLAILSTICRPTAQTQAPAGSN